MTYVWLSRLYDAGHVRTGMKVEKQVGTTCQARLRRTIEQRHWHQGHRVLITTRRLQRYSVPGQRRARTLSRSWVRCPQPLLRYCDG